MTTRVLCLTALLLVCACGPAQAASLRVFGGADDGLLSDGERWAVIPVQRSMEIVDGRSGARRTVDLAAPCASQFGQPRGVGAGLVLVECSFRVNQTRPRLLRLPPNRLLPLPQPRKHPPPLHLRLKRPRKPLQVPLAGRIL